MSYSLAEAVNYLIQETGEKNITPRMLCEWAASYNHPKLQVAYFGDAIEQLSWDVNTLKPVFSETKQHISNWFYLTPGHLFKFMFNDSVKIDFFILDSQIWWPDPPLEITLDKLVMHEKEALILRDVILNKDLNVKAITKTDAQHIKGMTKRDIAKAFDGIHFSYDEWIRNLADFPKWLEPCLVFRGSKKKHLSHLWNPVLIALALMDSPRLISIKRLDTVFTRLKDWQSEWQDKTELER